MILISFFPSSFFPSSFFLIILAVLIARYPFAVAAAGVEILQDFN